MAERERRDRRQRRDSSQRADQHADGTPRLRPEQIDEIQQQLNLPAFAPPWLLEAAVLLKNNPDDAEITRYFLEELEIWRTEADPGVGAYTPNYPPAGTLLPAPGEIGLGDLPTRDALTLALETPCRNVFIAGATGMGKTVLQVHLIRQLVAAGYVVVAFDRKTEFRDLLNDPVIGPRTSVLSSDQLRLSLYQPIAGVPNRIVHSSITELVARTTGRMYAQWLLEDLVHELSGDRQSATGLPLEAILEGLRTMPVKGFRQQELRDSILLAVSHIRNHLGAAYRYQRTDMLDRMFDEPCRLFVIETGTLPGDLHGFLTVYMAQMLYLKRVYNQSTVPPVLFSLDDVTVATDAQMDRQSASGVSALAEQTFMGRGLGMGFMLAVHAPSSTSGKVLTNCESRIFLGLHGENPHFLQTVLGATREQAEMIRTLQPGAGVAVVPSKWPHPLVFTYPYHALDRADHQLCRASAERLLAQVTSEEFDAAAAVASPAKQSEASAAAPSTSGDSPAGLTDDERQKLLPLAQALPPPLTKWYSQVGLNRRKGGKLVDKLQHAGLLRVHDCPASGRGGDFRLPELTDVGWNELLRNGLVKRPDRLTHGGFLHEAAAEALRRLAGQEGCTVDFEVDLHLVRVDARWRYPDGRLIFFQIGVSDTKREIDGLQRALLVPAVQQGRLVLVAQSRQFVDTVRQAFQSVSNLDTRLLGDLVKAAQ